MEKCLILNDIYCIIFLKFSCFCSAGGAARSPWRLHSWRMGLWCSGKTDSRSQESPERRRTGAHWWLWSHRSEPRLTFSSFRKYNIHVVEIPTHSSPGFTHVLWTPYHWCEPIVLWTFLFCFQEATKATVWEWWWNCSAGS